jgi:hypothetical protein
MRRASLGAFPSVVFSSLAVILAAAPVLVAQGELNRVSGVVKDDTGVPVKGAIVTANNPASAPTTYTTTTDEKGRFAILGLRRGVWTITAKAPGYEPDEISGPIQRGRPIPPIEFMLRRLPQPGPRGALAGVDVSKVQADLKAAESAAAAGKVDEALALYAKTVAEVPALSEVNAEIGELYTRKREPEKALAAYQKLLAANPEDERAKTSVCEIAFTLGMAALERHDTAAAAKYLEQSIAADPDSARAADARAALERLKRSL